MLNIHYDEETIRRKRDELRRQIHSPNIHGGSFGNLNDADLLAIFRLYDALFFQGYFRRQGENLLRFRLSRQLSRSAGLTRYARNFDLLPPEKRVIEIKISLNHLDAFDSAAREKRVGGLIARDKLDALLLVLEHELCHAAEFLEYGATCCSGSRFKTMASCIFGHKSSLHELPSRAEAGSLRYGLNAGDRVRFDWRGKRLSGVIVRIDKRAVVMAEERTGRYVDSFGRRYGKYLVPLSLLTKIRSE